MLILIPGLSLLKRFTTEGITVLEIHPPFTKKIKHPYNKARGNALSMLVIEQMRSERQGDQKKKIISAHIRRIRDACVDSVRKDS